MKEAAEELARLTEAGSGSGSKSAVLTAEDKPGWMIIREDRDSDHGRLYDPMGAG